MKRWWTEADVRSRASGGQLRVDAGVALTPAARDWAAAVGLRIVDGSACAGPPAQDLSVAGLPDGDYLLEVRSGAARVRRIDR